MEELHEFLGMVGLVSLITTVVTGIMIYRYSWIKNVVGKIRPRIKSVHYYGAICFAMLFLLHFITTNKTHFLLYIGSFFLCSVLVLGFLLKYSKKYFIQIINIKIILLIIAAICLPIGHSIVDKHDDLEESKHYDRSFND